MKHLYIVRHAIAVEHGTPGYTDDERPLTPAGRSKMREIARGFAQLEPDLDAIVTSRLPRALETAEILANRLGLCNRMESDDALAVRRSADEIASWLKNRTETNLLIVGHNPAFSELVALLTVGGTDPPVCNLRRGGIAALAATPEGGFVLDWMARPSLLRRLGD